MKTAQDWVLEHAPAGVVKALGLDKEQEAADVAAHPNYEFAGELAPNLLAFRPGAMAEGAREGATTVEKLMAHPATARALPATIMGAQEAATEKADGQDLDPTKIAIAAGVGAASNKMTRIGHFLTGSGVGPVIGLQAALRNRGKGGEPDVGAMRDITPEGPGPAPPGTPRLEAPIDPQDIQPGDEESPIPTSIIAAGRKVVREATTPVSQYPENAHILEQNGWPKAGTPVTLSDGETPDTTGVIHSGFETPHPETGEVGHGLNIALDNGDMFHAFKQEIDAAGIQITPQQIQQAGLPLDLATQAPAAATVPSEAPMAPDTAVPVPAAPRPAGMPVDLFQPPRTANPPEFGGSSIDTASAAVPPVGINNPPEINPTPPTGDGTQAAPIEVTHPDHVEQASALVNTAPTEAQAEAGNYKKLHLKVQGLPITIENPKGSVRRGVDADGKPWEVSLPASYGYIKRTTAADGEHVDVYVGHNPQSSKVFVIDQKDAKTGAYDEAKSFVGFDTKEQALATYHAAFSDGLGPERMGGIREMNTLQFKKLLNSGALDKPVAGGATVAEVQPPPRAAPSDENRLSVKPIVKTARAPLAPSRETSVLENIRRMGGIKTLDDQGQHTKEGQDIHAVLKDVNRPGLINNQTGQRPDAIRESLKAQGWFGSHPEAGADIQDLYDLIHKEVRDGPQFHPESAKGIAVADKAIADDNARALQDVHDEAKKGGGKPLTPEEADQIVLNMGADRIDAEDAVSDFLERKYLRWQYEDNAEETAHAAAAPEPVNRGTGEVDRTHGQGGEESPPASSNADGAPGSSGETPRDTGEAHLATERDAEGLNQTIVPGAEKSAQQLAKAREAQGHGRATTSVEQKDAVGMFAPKVEETQDMFAAPAKVEPVPEPVAAPKPKLVKKQQPKLSIAEKLAQKKPLKEAERRALYDAYFTVGRTVEGYGGKDIVTTAPKWGTDGHFTVGVRGLSFNGKETPGERERFHSTTPDTKKLLAFAKSDEFQDGKYVAPATKAEPESDTPAEPKFLPSKDQRATIKGKDFRIVAPQSPEFAAQREAVARALRAELDKIGLHDVGLKIADSLHMEVNGEHADDANGLYWQGVISVALADHAEASARLNHEVIHAIKDLGLFTKTEWAMLDARAKSTWRAQFDVDKRWPALAGNEAKLNEEAIAEAYDAFKKESGPSEKGIIARLLDRLRNAFAAIARGLRGLGFRTEESVFGPDGRDFFRKIDSGKVGARRRPLEPYRGVEHEPSFSHAEDHQAALDGAWDKTIAATAKKLGWEGEPTSRAMYAKALLTPKGPAKTELARNAGLIKVMEDQRATPFKQGMTPNKGDGETKVRGASQGAADMAAKRGHTIEDLPTYDVSDQEAFMVRARKFVSNDANKDHALAVAMGQEPAPYGHNAVAIRIAVEERAAKDGEWNLVNDVATKSKLNEEATTSGQNNAMYAQRDPYSPAAAMQEVAAARKSVAPKSPAAAKAKKNAVQDMLDAINEQAKRSRKEDKTSKAAKKLKFQVFLNGIICK